MTRNTSGAPDRAVRRRVGRIADDLLHAVAVPNPFDLGGFCAALAEHRGRPLTLVGLRTLLGDKPVPAQFSGLWLAGPDVDYLFYDDTTTPLHQRTSVLHEIAHMVLGHRSSERPQDVHLTLMRILLPDLDPVVVRRTMAPGLCRARDVQTIDGYSDVQEREAETLATVLIDRLQFPVDADLRRESPTAISGGDADVLSRMAGGLTARRQERP
ncbi:hypothetical protein ACIRG5_45420 [Lentzea sp. NPDC102401]|uniref:hypothetical protein n=1 Tax=Lentzea sp. NPDC102401 TaxID=3364128 RepID=UPI00381F586F